MDCAGIVEYLDAMNPPMNTLLTVGLGRSKERFPVQTLREASTKYAAARDASGMGASEFPEAYIYRDGTKFARISYNGRVWDLATKGELCVS